MIQRYESLDVDEITNKIRNGWFLCDTVKFVKGKPLFLVIKSD